MVIKLKFKSLETWNNLLITKGSLKLARLEQDCTIIQSKPRSRTTK